MAAFKFCFISVLLGIISRGDLERQSGVRLHANQGRQERSNRCDVYHYRNIGPFLAISPTRGNDSLLLTPPYMLLAPVQPPNPCNPLIMGGLVSVTGAIFLTSLEPGPRLRLPHLSPQLNASSWTSRHSTPHHPPGLVQRAFWRSQIGERYTRGTVSRGPTPRQGHEYQECNRFWSLHPDFLDGHAFFDGPDPHSASFI